MIINVTKCHKSSQVLLFSVQTQNSDNMKENGFQFFQFTTMKKGEKQQVQKFHLMNFIDFFRKYMIIVMPSTSAGGFLFGNRWTGPGRSQSGCIWSCHFKHSALPRPPLKSVCVCSLNSWLYSCCFLDSSDPVLLFMWFSLRCPCSPNLPSTFCLPRQLNSNNPWTQPSPAQLRLPLPWTPASAQLGSIPHTAHSSSNPTPLNFDKKPFASIHSISVYGKYPDLARNIRVARINSVMGMLSFILVIVSWTGIKKEHPLKAQFTSKDWGKFHHSAKLHELSNTF